MSPRYTLPSHSTACSDFLGLFFEPTDFSSTPFFAEPEFVHVESESKVWFT
jgi:hypothetical protein